MLDLILFTRATNIDSSITNWELIYPFKNCFTYTNYDFNFTSNYFIDCFNMVIITIT